MHRHVAVARPPRAAIAFLALLASLAFMVVTARPAEASTYGSAERQMTYHLNRARAYYGLRALRVHYGMSRDAEAHSVRMADAGSIFHVADLGRAMREYTWRVVGENVGYGPGMYSIYRAFMKSRPHRANMLYRSYRYVGVGVVSRGDVQYVTLRFLG